MRVCLTYEYMKRRIGLILMKNKRTKTEETMPGQNTMTYKVTGTPMCLVPEVGAEKTRKVNATKDTKGENGVLGVARMVKDGED